MENNDDIGNWESWGKKLSPGTESCKWRYFKGIWQNGMETQVRNRVVTSAARMATVASFRRMWRWRDRSCWLTCKRRLSAKSSVGPPAYNK